MIWHKFNTSKIRTFKECSRPFKTGELTMTTKPKLTTNEVHATFVLLNETKGALRFQEVDDKGNALKSDADKALMGTVYLRKAAVKGSIPKYIRMILQFGG